MSDPFDPPEDDPGIPAGHRREPEPSGGDPFPWNAASPPDGLSASASAEEDADLPRRRHDGFTEARKAEFLTALVKTGCIADACRRIGVSRRTVYRHQEDDPGFFDHCRAALKMSGTPVELTAWQRAVEGVEEEFVVGGEVRVRRRYDGGLLRLLLQGSNPKKYGPRPGFTRKRLLKHERKQMEREIRAELHARMEEKRVTFDDTIESLGRQLDAMARAEEPKKLADGWTRSEDGLWIPPGYGPLPGYTPPAAEKGEAAGESADRSSGPRDSL